MAGRQVLRPPRNAVVPTLDLPFRKRVNKNGRPNSVIGPCWEWTGAKLKRGYGTLNVHGRKRLAHRYSWTMEHGPVPAGKLVLHKCDNPSCVRPTHLFVGTHKDNTQDMIAKLRGAQGEKQHAAKLTAQDVADIRKRYRRYSHQHGTGVLAREYGVGAVEIWRVVHGHRWRHLG